MSVQVIRLRSRIVKRAAALGAAAFLFLSESLPAARQARAPEPDEPSGHVSGSGAWSVLEGARFDAGKYADGDSFHVRHHGSSHVFRLYFVDTPETDNTFKKRTTAQARYFAVTKAQARQIAREAAEFTAQQLSRPFVVRTEWTDARGSGWDVRSYAWIDTEQGSLAELLVRRGYARCFGARADIPGVGRAEDIMRRLQHLEDLARQEKAGAWALSKKPTKKTAKGARHHGYH